METYKTFTANCEFFPEDYYNADETDLYYVHLYYCTPYGSLCFNANRKLDQKIARIIILCYVNINGIDKNIVILYLNRICISYLLCHKNNLLYVHIDES